MASDVLTALRQAVGDEALSIEQAVQQLIADRDAQRAYRDERHARVLELIAQKKVLTTERDRLMEHVAVLETELRRRHPSVWERLKRWLQDAP